MAVMLSSITHKRARRLAPAPTSAAITISVGRDEGVLMTHGQPGATGVFNRLDSTEPSPRRPPHWRRRSAKSLTLTCALAMFAALTACGTTDTSGDSAGAASTTPSPSPSPTTTTTTTPQPPPVDKAALPGLLPSLDELKTITGNPSLITGPVFNAVETPNPGEQTFEPADCVSSFNAGAPPAYQNSGYLAFHGASQAQSPTPSLMLGEAVATFHTAEAAQKALAAYIEQWRRCATKRFTWNFVSQGQQSQWTLGQPVDAGGGVTSLRNVNDNSPVTVTRAIAAKNNVLVDVQIMGSGLTEQNITIANRILERIPG